MGQFDDLETVTPALTIGIVWYLDVSENNGTPKSSILIGFSIIFTIHFGVPLFLETPIYVHFWCLRNVFQILKVGLFTAVVLKNLQGSLVLCN